jgi:hypothetical protein
LKWGSRRAFFNEHVGCLDREIGELNPDEDFPNTYLLLSNDTASHLYQGSVRLGQNDGGRV